MVVLKIHVKIKNKKIYNYFYQNITTQTYLTYPPHHRRPPLPINKNFINNNIYTNVKNKKYFLYINPQGNIIINLSQVTLIYKIKTKH